MRFADIYFRLTGFERMLVLFLVAVVLIAALPLPGYRPHPSPMLVSRDTLFAMLADTAIRFPLNVNLAAPELLELVPGIGRTLAQRIVEARHRQPFHSIGEIAYRVRGIGAVRISEIAPYLTVPDSSGQSAK